MAKTIIECFKTKNVNVKMDFLMSKFLNAQLAILVVKFVQGSIFY